MKGIAAICYQIKVDSGTNLTRSERRFTAADESFAERFAAENKHFNVKHLNAEITYSNCQIGCQIGFQTNCQINERATESKAAGIDYQDLQSTKAEMEIAKEITKEITIGNEFNTN